jgi:tRNA(Arg) A34 adenosine deaminase TadA
MRTSGGSTANPVDSAFRPHMEAARQTLNLELSARVAELEEQRNEHLAVPHDAARREVNLEEAAETATKGVARGSRDERWMRAAIVEARRSLLRFGGAQIGCVIVRAGMIVAAGHSQVGPTGDPTQHAEIRAIQVAARTLGRADLADCELYCTLEPCGMCLSACAWASLDRVVFGAGGGDVPAHYYEQVGYSAVTAAERMRRDVDRRRLTVAGGVLADATARLLTRH